QRPRMFPPAKSATRSRLHLLSSKRRRDDPDPEHDEVPRQIQMQELRLCSSPSYSCAHCQKTRTERLDDSTSTTMSTKFEHILCELICGDGESHETQHKNQYGYYCDGNPCRAQRFFFNNGRMPDLHPHQN